MVHNIIIECVLQMREAMSEVMWSSDKSNSVMMQSISSNLGFGQLTTGQPIGIGRGGGGGAISPIGLQEGALLTLFLPPPPILNLPMPMETYVTPVLNP